MNEKLRVLVLEDEWAARNYLTELLEGSGLAKVVAVAADTDQAWAALRASDAFGIDAAFVDVHLAGEPSLVAGVDWLRAVKVSEEGRQMHFVVTTASREHAVDAFELGAIDYLVKPFTAERVKQCLQRLTPATRVVREPTPPEKIVARDGKTLVFLAIDRVVAFEASEGLSFVYTGGVRYDVDLSLAALASVLGSAFMRVHRNWLVRVDAVRALERDGAEASIDVGQASLRIPIARDRLTSVRDMLMASAVGLRRGPT